MSESAKMRKALADFVNKRSPQVSVVCTVKTINMATLTCYCEPINGDAGITDVRLMAIASKGFLEVPKVNSQVVVMFIDDTTAVVSKTSTIEEMQLNGDFYGGLAIVEKLVEKYNNLENKVNAIIASYNAHTHPYLNLATPAVTSSTTTPVAGTLNPTVRTEIENDLIKHGNGT